MKEKKAHELLSGFVDDELSPDKRFKVLNEIKTNSWCKKEYEGFRKLKASLSSLSPHLAPSPNFEANLREKIYYSETQQSWFDRLIDTGFFNKSFYGLATASILFMAFFGVKIYLSEIGSPTSLGMGSSNTTAMQTSNDLTEIVSSKQGLPIKGTDGALVFRYSSKGNYLVISKEKENKSIKIDLRTWKPYYKLDNKIRRSYDYSMRQRIEEYKSKSKRQ